MTYNVRYFGHGTRGVASTRAGVRRIAKGIASLSPLADVICLQEVETRSLRSALCTRKMTQLDVLTAELDAQLTRRGIVERYQATYFPAHEYRLTQRTKLYTTGLAVLVRPRLRIVDHNARSPQDITHRRGARSLKQTRVCAHIALEHDTLGALDVFNTHMSLPGFFYPEFWLGEARLGFGPNQLREARRLVETIEHRKRCDNVVLVGDFNSLPDSPVDQLLRARAGLVDALAVRHGAASARQHATAGFSRLRMNIDRIYSSPSVRWLDFDGTHPFGDKLPRNRFAGLSDHAPLLGRLELAS